MQKRALGNTGIQISEIAFGGVEIGLPYGIGVKSEADMLTEADAIKLLHNALDCGINFFDTARLYGESERIMGNAFYGRRQEVVLATKCRHLRDPEGKIPSYAGLNELVRASLRESLQALGTDYIDLYMVHYADQNLLANEDLLRVFTKLREEGTVRAIGVSVYKTEETRRAIQCKEWNAIQLPFNLMDQSQGTYFTDAAREGIGLIVRSVLMRGMLSDRMSKLHPALKDVEAHLGKYRSLLRAGFTHLPQLATKFALAHPEVSAVLVGIDKQDYLEDALDAVNGVYMDEDLLKEAQALAYPDPAFLNLTEWDKKGWL
ncbi:aldo/keto reductase [Parapedobacter indicus]|uniref:Predicted oxidoreductase n=1 Tax=Parapedobacter indicus TaxID=1477437 RepID=A0A1I3GTR4_9SPHI|nr:aldo/keto reductase [Parapedobacter indicus]PPL02779.1 aryl-alcohol dehydrogenase-like predicted oxidoreductase [Parapedobacter indicus]SFI26834.1 Predicted oxidoreductase [Parapedobacter indicus]